MAQQKERERTGVQQVGAESPAGEGEPPRVPSGVAGAGGAPPAPPPDLRPPGMGVGHRRQFPRARGENGLPAVPTADPDPCPRVIADFERAPPGRKRFKVRVQNAIPATTRYVLARDEAEARKAYLEYCTFNLVESSGDGVPREPLLYVAALPD